MAAPVLFLVRHGETPWNAEGRLQGGSDVPLNALGRAQAAEAARRLASLAPRLDALAFVGSPMRRARETMTILRETLGLPPEEGWRADPRLVELSFGEWEGLTWPEVAARDPDGYAAREADGWGFTPPGGESYATMADRAMAAVDEIDRDAVVVCHGGVMRAILVRRAGLAVERAPGLEVLQGRVMLLQGSSWRWV